MVLLVERIAAGDGLIPSCSCSAPFGNHPVRVNRHDLDISEDVIIAPEPALFRH